MNFFAHGRRFVGRPYFVAGTAIPDWLNVVNRRAKTRSKSALPLTQHDDDVIAEVARGVVQHHHDDRWFHMTRAFNETSLGFTRHIREHFDPTESLLPMFLGHILVELLLDATLIQADPPLLDEYYAALQHVDAERTTNVVRQMTDKDVDLLMVVIRRFVAEPFLQDYLADDTLFFRLNRIMHRVGLPEIPDDFVQWLPEARRIVMERQDDLLTEPD
jgi:hypothetical protein